MRTNSGTVLGVAAPAGNLTATAPRHQGAGRLNTTWSLRSSPQRRTRRSLTRTPVPSWTESKYITHLRHTWHSPIRPADSTRTLLEASDRANGPARARVGRRQTTPCSQHYRGPDRWARVGQTPEVGVLYPRTLVLAPPCLRLRVTPSVILATDGSSRKNLACPSLRSLFPASPAGGREGG